MLALLMLAVAYEVLKIRSSDLKLSDFVIIIITMC